MSDTTARLSELRQDDSTHRSVRPVGPANLADATIGVNGNVGEGEKDVLLLAAHDRGVAEASLDADHTAGQHTAQTVGGEAGAKDGLCVYVCVCVYVCMYACVCP